MRYLPGVVDSNASSFPRSASDRKVGRGPSDQRDTKGRYERACVQIIERRRTLPSLPGTTTAHWLALTSLSSLSRIRRLPITAAASSTRPGRIMIVRWPSTARLSNSNLVWGWPTATAGASHRDRKDYDRALTDYNKAIEINPRDASRIQLSGNPRRGSKGHSSRVGRLQQGHRGRSKICTCIQQSRLSI